VGRQAVAVTSVEEEDRLLGTCSCGSAWRLASEDVVPISRRWYDALVLCCPSCGASIRAIFDITPFFVPHSRAWARAA